MGIRSAPVAVSRILDSSFPSDSEHTRTNSIISSIPSTLGTIRHGNGSGYLRHADPRYHQRPTQDGVHPHRKTARKLVHHRHLPPVLVARLRRCKHRQEGRDRSPDGRVCKMSPHAHRSTEVKCDVLRIVRPEGPVVFEETLGKEFVQSGLL